MRKLLGPWHYELTRSDAANQYCWKEDTRIAGTQFELGKLPIKRNSKTDWDSVFSLARSGNLDEIDKSILVRHYGSLKRIRQDYLEPAPMERTCIVFWGPTGTGKSRTAWRLAGLSAYPKDPRTKFWDGYRDQEHVVIDEFRGAIDLSHVLRWIDRYPVIVEVKGSSTVLNAKTIWITSNLNPNMWYPGLDNESFQALLRRLIVIHFDGIDVNHDTFDLSNYGINREIETSR